MPPMLRADADVPRHDFANAPDRVSSATSGRLRQDAAGKPHLFLLSPPPAPPGLVAWSTCIFLPAEEAPPPHWPKPVRHFGDTSSRQTRRRVVESSATVDRLRPRLRHRC